MAAQLESGRPRRVALLGRDDAVRAQLQSALQESGADLVLVADLAAARGDAVRAAQAEVLIVNLEPGSEDVLDALDDVLGDAGIEVVFNESETTSRLIGWDLARWARHLAAKVGGHGDPTPPPPPGAEPLPARDLRLTEVGLLRPPPREDALRIERFTDEARGRVDAVPAAGRPDDPVVEVPAGADLPPSDPLPEAVAETAPADGFELDLGEIEQALAGRTLDVPPPVLEPRRAAADAPTVVLPLSDLHAELAVAADAPVEVAPMPRRLGPDEPTTVLDLAEIEASLAALSPNALEVTTTSASIDADAGGFDFELDLSAVGTAPAQADESVDVASADPSMESLYAAAEDFAPDPRLETAVADEPLEDETGLSLDLDAALADFDPAAAATTRLPVADGDALDLDMDADLAALAAQFDSLSAEGARAAESRIEPFEFSRQPSTGSAEESAGSLQVADRTGQDRASADALAERETQLLRGFGELSLLDHDADHLAGGVSKQPSSYDFSGIELALEPIEDIAAEAAASAPPRVSKGLVSRIIVLGASIGGPDALRTFLADIPAGFPALFVLVQHLENGFFGRLAQQLQKTTGLKLRLADDDAGPARHGEVLVVPSNAAYTIDVDGRIQRQAHAAPPRYTPCIDDVLRAVADEFGSSATAIIFSGMAGDAIEGASYLASKKGEVWAQDPASCVVSSMVDGAIARGVVDYVGSPRELAVRCVAKYRAA